MRLFGWFRKFYFPEIEIRWPKKNAFDHGNRFTLLFSLQSISGKWERERESARAREEKRRTRSRRREIAPLVAISPSRDHAVDRDLAFARSRRQEIREEDPSRKIARSERKIRQSRSRLCKIAPLIAISPSRDRTGERSERKNLNCVWVFSRLWLLFFWICVFLLLFQTLENIFRKIFWNATKHMEIFSFSEN